MREVPPDRTQEIAALKRGETIEIRPTGPSMIPRIRPHQRVTIRPFRGEWLSPHMIVLCRVNRLVLLHTIKDMRVRVGDDQDPETVKAKLSNRHVRYLITNAKGTPNGWISPLSIYGVVMRVEG